MNDELNIILKFYQDLLIKINKCFSITRIFFGNPTKSLDVTYCDKEKDYIWKVTAESIQLISAEPAKPLSPDTQEIEIRTPLLEKEISGMYYNEGSGSFFFWGGENSVVISFTLGPLYGRTCIYEIVKKKDRMKLIKKQTIMVS